MDTRYREIYAAIYVGRTGRVTDDPFLTRQYGQWRPARRGREPETGAMLRDAIERAEVRYGRVREDAKALLAVNFQDLVILPLVVGQRVSLEELLPEIGEDINTLVASATETLAPDPEGISGHAVINALSKNWERLRIARFRLWEGSDER